MLQSLYLKDINGEYQGVRPLTDFLYLTWCDVQRLAEAVADLVWGEGFQPDLVVAVSRGGFDPARILCDQLDVRRLASLQLANYQGVLDSLAQPKVVFPLNADVEGLRVLLVDDVADSGRSLGLAKRLVEEAGAAEARVATLHWKPWSDFKPDFYAEEVTAWVIYPWEVRESLLDIYRGFLLEGVSQEEARARLREIGFTQREIDRHLGLLESD